MKKSDERGLWAEKWDCTPKKWIFQWQNFKPFVFFHKFGGKFVKIFLFLIFFFLPFLIKNPKNTGSLVDSIILRGLWVRNELKRGVLRAVHFSVPSNMGVLPPLYFVQDCRLISCGRSGGSSLLMTLQRVWKHALNYVQCLEAYSMISYRGNSQSFPNWPYSVCYFKNKS